MAFCKIEPAHVENFTGLVFSRIRKNPAALKNFKDFSQEIFQFLLGKGQTVERAIAFTSFLPQIVGKFTSESQDRKLLREAGVSMDAISNVEDMFGEYTNLAKYLGIKEEAKPITVVNDKQVGPSDKIAAHTADTKVEFAGDVRLVNGKKYETRVTGIAKVGFDDKEQDNQDSPLEDTPALKHGNTVDAIAKAVFDEQNPKFEQFKDLIDEQAFEALVSRLRAVKSALEGQGYIFKTAVTVYDKELGISGEIDLVAINPEGEALIMDFKTANTRFNETNLRNETLAYKSQDVEVTILSKWKQYSTQGYIYSLLLAKQLGIPSVNRVGIIGINIQYDAAAPLETNKITKVVGSEVINIPFAEVRPEFKDKTLAEIHEEYKKLLGQSLGPVSDLKPRRRLPGERTQRKELDRIASINEIAATEPQLKAEIDWWTTGPLGQSALLALHDVINSGLFGKWTLKGVTIFKGASQGTVYHEGWHQFSQVFMTQKQKKSLYDSIRKDGIALTTRDGRKVNTATSGYLDIEEFLAEEFAKYAIDPSKYKYPTKNPEPKNLFERILAFLRRYFGKATDKLGLTSPHPLELFQKLYTGRVSDYVPSINNAYWSNLNSLAENRKGEEIVSNERFPLYVQTFDYLIGRDLHYNNKRIRSFTSFKQSKSLQADVLFNVFAALEEKFEDPNTTEQQSKEILSIIQNKEDFIRAYTRSTAYETLKDFIVEEGVFTKTQEEIAADEEFDKYLDAVPEDGDEGDVSRVELYTPDANEESAFSLADDAIQDFFRTIPKIKGFKPDGTPEYELNELGFPQNHKFYDVFYKTKRLLSGAFDMSEMKARMSDPNNQRLHPELKLINEFIGKFMDANITETNYVRAIQNVQFIQSFHIVMSMPEVPNMQLTMNYLPLTKPAGYFKTTKPIMVSYRTASRNLVLKIIKSWEKNFKDRRGKTLVSFENWETTKNSLATRPLYKTEDGKILLNPFINYGKLFTNSLDSVTKESAPKNGLKDFWDLMGVTINPKAYTDRKAVEELIKIKNILITNIDTYRASIQPLLLDELDKILIDTGIDTEQFTTVEAFLQALPAIAVDVYAKEFFISNPITFFNEVQEVKVEVTQNKKTVKTPKNTVAMRFKFEDLAAIEEVFGERVSSGSFRIEDKTKYPYYIPNQILMTTELLNKLSSTTQFKDNKFLNNLDPLKNKWMSRSYFMKRMFDFNGKRAKDENGNPIRILIEDVASVRVISEDEEGRTITEEKAPRSLLRDEKFFMDILTLFKAGAIEIPRAETSSTMFSVRLSDYGKGKTLPITLAESLPKGSLNIPETFIAIVKDYFASEIEKRQWYRDNDPAVVGANKKALKDQFNVFEGILSQGLRDKVVANLTKTPEEIFATDTIESEFRKEIEDYFTKEIEEILPRFKELSIEQQAMLRDTAGVRTGTGLKSMARAFVINHFILSQEFYQLYFGDLYFYKNSFKRGKYVTNTGNSFYIDDIRNEMLNGIQKSTMHSIFTGEKTGGKDFSKVKTSIMNDVEMRSAYISEDDEDNILLQDALKVRVSSGALAPGTSEYAKFITDTKKSLGFAENPRDRKGYYNINIADGQGIIGMDFYRNFSIIVNIWDEKKEAEYERQKAIFRNHYNLYFTRDENGNKVEMQGEELRAAKEADKQLRGRKPFAFFNPLKISHTGPLAKDGPIRPVFDKFSVRPIIPEMAIGKRDEDLMIRMAETDIDYIKFRSGSKVYQDKSFDWYDKVSDGTYNQTNFNVEEIDPTELMSANLKHQLSTEGFKEENIFGSQFRKIVFGVKYGANARVDPEAYKFFAGLENRFIAVVGELLEAEQAELFSLLGVKEVNGNYEIKDMKKFLNLLQTESVKRGVAVNNIDYIQYDEDTKNVRYPIDYAFNRQQIQDLLSGLIDERLRRLKVNGSSLIQVSSAGSESKRGGVPVGYGSFRKPTSEEIRKYGTTGLQYYQIVYDRHGNPIRTGTMGVKVAMSKAYEGLFQLDAPASLGTSDTIIKLKNEVIQTLRGPQSAGKIGFRPGRSGEKLIPLSEEESLARLNEALKDPEWRKQHADKLRLIGYRIPTQNMNFIDHMEIMEFLPRSAGAIIIPPIELIIKSGSDFDIDKMNIIRPYLNDAGQLIKPRKSKVTDKEGNVSYVEDTLAFISQKISELTVDERELKRIKKQISGIINGLKGDYADLEKKQLGIRYTMLNIAIESGVNDALVDKMMQYIKEKQKGGIIPENAIPDEDAFTDEEIRDFTEERLYLIGDYMTIDKLISDVLAKIETKEEERAEIGGEDLEWFNRKRDYKNSRNNELIYILRDLMSHKYYFEHLITPSSASMFESLTNNLMASQANMTPEQFADAMRESEGKMFDKSMTPQKASTYGATSEAFDNLLSKRKDLGGYAIQRTFTDIFNFVQLSIAQEYTVNIGGENYESKMLYTPLISAADKDKVVKNGRIMMHGDSVTGIPISKAFDELISLTVDLAGSPAYPKMGINTYNKKHLQYLLHQKVDPKVALWFINQPILKELFAKYEKQRRNVSGYTLKHAIVELSLQKKILENPPTYENSPLNMYEVYNMVKTKAEYDINQDILEDAYWTRDNKKANPYLRRRIFWDLHTQNLKDSDHFTFEAMDKAIRDNDTNSDMQKKILAYFASITDESNLLMNLEFAENVDTNKYATLTSLIRNENMRREVRNSGLFDLGQINRLEKESMIAPFDYTEKAKSIFQTLFPKLYTDATISTFSALIDDIPRGTRNVQVERISKIIENDLIEYVYKNYGTYQGKNLSGLFQGQLVNLDSANDHEYFSERLNAIKAKYEELLDIPFVGALYEDTYFPPDGEIEKSYKDLDNKEMHNIFFLRNPDNPTFEKNVFTNNWRNLIDFDPERLGLSNTYSEEEVREISDFFNDLVYFSLYQSGLTNTGNGFSDLIPYEKWAAFIEDAFDNYERAKVDNSGLELQMLREFEHRFKQMNPKVNWRTKTRKLTTIDEKTGQSDKEQMKFFKNYYRGKDYFVTDDDLLMARFMYYVPEDDVYGPADVNKPQNQSPFEPGVYVDFDGETHILVKRLKNDVWQTLNPFETGDNAFRAGKERDMTTLKDRGAVIEFGTKNYLVTKDNEIIDLVKAKKLRLSNSDINRKKILELAKEKKNPPKPPPDAIGPEGSPQVEPECPF